MQSRVEGHLLLDPTEDEAYQEDGGLLLAYMPQASLVGCPNLQGAHMVLASSVLASLTQEISTHAVLDFTGCAACWRVVECAPGSCTEICPQQVAAAHCDLRGVFVTSREGRSPGSSAHYHGSYLVGAGSAGDDDRPVEQ